MKNWGKRALSFIIAAMLICSMGTVAFAADAELENAKTRAESSLKDHAQEIKELIDTFCYAYLTTSQYNKACSDIDAAMNNAIKAVREATTNEAVMTALQTGRREIDAIFLEAYRTAEIECVNRNLEAFQKTLRELMGEYEYLTESQMNAVYDEVKSYAEYIIRAMRNATTVDEISEAYASFTAKITWGVHRMTYLGIEAELKAYMEEIRTIIIGFEYMSEQEKSEYISRIQAILDRYLSSLKNVKEGDYEGLETILKNATKEMRTMLEEATKANKLYELRIKAIEKITKSGSSAIDKINNMKYLTSEQKAEYVRLIEKLIEEYKTELENAEEGKIDKIVEEFNAALAALMEVIEEANKPASSGNNNGSNNNGSSNNGSNNGSNNNGSNNNGSSNNSSNNNGSSNNGSNNNGSNNNSSNKGDDANLPHSGDNVYTVLYIALALIACGALVLIVRKRKTAK